MADGRPRKGPQTCRRQELASDIRRLVDQRPSYGYQRIAALLASGDPPATTLLTAKRVYRLMKKHGLLVQRQTGRRSPCVHDGKRRDDPLERALVLGCAGVQLFGRRSGPCRLCPGLPRPESHPMGGYHSRDLWRDDQGYDGSVC